MDDYFWITLFLVILSLVELFQCILLFAPSISASTLVDSIPRDYNMYVCLFYILHAGAAPIHALYVASNLFCIVPTLLDLCKVIQTNSTNKRMTVLIDYIYSVYDPATNTNQIRIILNVKPFNLAFTIPKFRFKNLRIKW